MTLPWWLWLLASLCLFIAEIVMPGAFFFVFFAVGAAIVALLALAWPDMPPTLGLTLFGILSVATLLLFRNRLKRSKLLQQPAATAIDSLEGEIGAALEDLAPGARGKVELRGAPWTGTNVGPTSIDKGARCRVLRVSGLQLEVISE